MVPPTIGWAFLHQSTIKKIPPQTCLQANLRAGMAVPHVGTYISTCFLVPNGCSSSNKHVHITAQQRRHKRFIYHRRTIDILKGTQGYAGYAIFISGDFVSGSASGVRWGTHLEPAGSLWHPIICLCFTGRLAVFPGTVPPAALNHLLFVLMPFLCLDIHPVLQHAARSPVRARLCTKHKAFPLASKAPWPLGPVICYSSAHLCPTL